MSHTSNAPGIAPKRNYFTGGIRTVALVLLVVAFWWTFRWMIARWNDTNSYYSHGWLILPVSVFLILKNRKKIAECQPHPSLWGIGVLALSLITQVLASMLQIGFLSGLALLGTLVGLVLTFFGWNMLRLTWFPIAFLLFMVPLPDELIGRTSFSLKMLAARAASATADALGLRVLRNGSYITLSSGQVIIVDDVCSGLKYLISLVAFGALYSAISSLKWWGKGTLFILAGPIALIANSTRVTLMILVAYQWGVAASQKWYCHDVLGFLLFVMAFVMLFMAESILRMIVRHKTVSGEQVASITPNLMPPEDSSIPSIHPVQSASHRLCLLAVILMLPAAGVSAYLSRPRPVSQASEALKSLPIDFNGWEGQDYEFDERVYDILGTRDVLSRTYTNRDGNRVQMIIVLAQQMGRRTHPPQQCLRGEGYNIISRKLHTIDMQTDKTARHRLTVNELIAEHNGRHRLVWYFFKNNQRLDTSYWQHQLNVSLSGLTRQVHLTDVLVRIETTVIGGDKEDARRLLSDFLEKIDLLILPKIP